MKAKQKSKSKWFLKVRGSYIPNNVVGWLLYIPFIAYLVLVPCVVSSNSENVAIAILICIPNWVAAAAVMTYIASVKS